MRRVYVTTSIPYVNARPHVGFALELVQADVIGRYHRLLGSQVRLQTGTDENAYKNVLSARHQGLTPQQLVDRHSEEFRRLVQSLDCSVDAFVRTTDERHRRGVHELWRRLRPGDLYRRRYRGLYCAGCEDFCNERDLVDGRCPDHGTAPDVVEEENWFFRLSAYQERLEDLVRGGRLRVVPEARRREVLAFIERGLEDISVSRRVERVEGWGIPVPDDPSQVIYVWIDALANYLTGPGLGSGDRWEEWWSGEVLKIHVIGKNVWKFHAVYWPALLLSAGLPLPDELVVHGFLTEGGRKISKSAGNAADPLDYVARYGIDGLRYFLLRGVSPFADGDVSEERLTRLYTADLANGLGNLASRLTALAVRAGHVRPGCAAAPREPSGYREALGEYGFDRALASLWTGVDGTNRDIEARRPWEAGDGGRQDPAAPLDRWLVDLADLAHWLQPFLPGTASRLLAALGPGRVGELRNLFPRLT